MISDAEILNQLKKNKGLKPLVSIADASVNI
jgi:hypothetical protein